MDEYESYEITDVYGEIRYVASDRGVLRYRLASGSLAGDSPGARSLRARVVADVLEHGTVESFDLYVVAVPTYEDGTSGEPALVAVDHGPTGKGIVLGVRHV